MAYYNEIDPFAAQWLRNLMAAGHITKGLVDERSIAEVQPDDIRGHGWQHYFAGIGGWDVALQLAGWPEDREVWTGSCPCQPLSCAGQRGGEKDERHLWPEFYRLISECRPATIFGEQVGSKDGLEWLDGISLDLEELGYAVGTSDLPAASLGAPHIRQRVFWVAHAKSKHNRTGQPRTGRRNGPKRAGSWSDRLGHAGDRELAKPQEQSARQERQAPSGAGGSDYLLVPCADGKVRRTSAQPGDEPLAYGIPRKLGPELAGMAGMAKAARSNRVGRVRGYGNAIVPQVAAEFIRAFLGVPGFG